MNTVFVLMSLSSIIGGWRFLGQYWVHKTILSLFGASLILTDFYQHAPIDSMLEYDIREDEIHSLFAKTTGWTFTIFAVSLGFICKYKSHQLLAIFIGIIAVILSLLMFHPSINYLMGIWQRLMFILTFGWLIYAFRKYELKNIS